jgi:hypothetical protein
MENLQPQVNKISQSQNSSKKKVPGGGRNASQQTIVTTDEEPSIAISRYLTLQLTMSGQRGEDVVDLYYTIVIIIIT